MTDRLAGTGFRVPLICLLAAVALATALGAQPVSAAERELPEAVPTAVDYLLSINSDPQKKTVTPGELAHLVAFILQDKPAEDQYVSTSHGLLDPLVYHEFEVRTSLAAILDYGFNPEIPSHVLALSSVRQSYWKEIDGRSPPFPGKIADRLEGLEAPLVIHGIEHEEIAPDLTSGAYYSYDLNRTLIMCRVEGKTVFISLARQQDLSDVGRKGYVLGPDDAWDYIYSGEKGINRMGLGWVDSFMYDAFSALVFVQADDHTPLVRCGLFKWLRAGWNDLNFVRSDHIRLGLERYAESFREILESPRLPPAARVAAAAGEIRALSLAQLRARGRASLAHLQARYGDADEFPEKWYEEAVANGTYLQNLTRPQLEAILFLDYMKTALGRQPETIRQAARSRESAARTLP